MRDFPYLRLGIRDFKGKSGRDLGLKVCTGGGMPKVTLGITGLPENLGRDYGTEKPYWVPSFYIGRKTYWSLFIKTVETEMNVSTVQYTSKVRSIWLHVHI